jgi:hypothetical protein
MEPSLWQHQSVEPLSAPIPRNPEHQAFASGVLFGIVLVATVFLWRRGLRGPRPPRRPRPLVTGWRELFRFLGSLVRGAVFLIFGLLLLGRILLWPAGRRW